MRISTSQMQNRGLNAILDRQGDLSHTQQQLATGKRVLTPSDDVFATTQGLAMKQVIATHEQFQDNSNVAEYRLMQEEISLDHMIEVMQRVRELGVQANNQTYGALERSNIAVEVRVLLDQIVDIANTADAGGEYIFSGLNVDTIPVTEGPVGTYTYTAADSGRRSIQLGVSTQVTIGDPGDAVFFNVAESGGGTRNIFETIDQFATDLENNTNLPSAVLLTDISLAMEHMGSYRSSSGARQTVIEGMRELNYDIILQGQATLSEVQDLDFAEAVSRLNLQLVGLEASQQSFTKIQNLSLFNFL